MFSFLARNRFLCDCSFDENRINWIDLAKNTFVRQITPCRIQPSGLLFKSSPLVLKYNLDNFIFSCLWSVISSSALSWEKFFCNRLKSPHLLSWPSVGLLLALKLIRTRIFILHQSKAWYIGSIKIPAKQVVWFDLPSSPPVLSVELPVDRGVW